MKLADLATGSDWIVWIVFVIFAVLSIVLLSGHGSWFISGYNTASKEEKKKYDEKKLCRTMGVGMSIIAILALIMGLLENILPAFFRHEEQVILVGKSHYLPILRYSKLIKPGSNCFFLIKVYIPILIDENRNLFESFS